MELNPYFTPQNLSETSPGDLISLWSGDGHELGIVVEYTEKGRKVVMLSGTNAIENLPLLREFPSNDNCLCFGKAWILDIELQSQTRESARCGTVSIFGKDVWLRVNRSAGYNFNYVNLHSLMACESTASEAAHFTKWKIWLDIEHKSRRAAEPLFSFGELPASP